MILHNFETHKLENLKNSILLGSLGIFCHFDIIHMISWRIYYKGGGDDFFSSLHSDGSCESSLFVACLCIIVAPPCINHTFIHLCKMISLWIQACEFVVVPSPISFLGVREPA
jgi:hypothetical protein